MTLFKTAAWVFLGFFTVAGVMSVGFIAWTWLAIFGGG